MYWMLFYFFIGLEPLPPPPKEMMLTFVQSLSLSKGKRLTCYCFVASSPSCEINIPWNEAFIPPAFYGPRYLKQGSWTRPVASAYPWSFLDSQAWQQAYWRSLRFDMILGESCACWSMRSAGFYGTCPPPSSWLSLLSGGFFSSLQHLVQGWNLTSFRAEA